MTFSNIRSLEFVKNGILRTKGGYSDL